MVFFLCFLIQLSKPFLTESIERIPSYSLDMHNFTGIYNNSINSYFQNVLINIFECQFLSCLNYDGQPGAILLEGNESLLYCSNTYFYNCRDFNGYGGAIRFTGNYLSMNNTRAELCSATMGGQFIYVNLVKINEHIISYFCQNSISQCSDSVEDAVSDSVFVNSGYSRIYFNNITNNIVMFYGSGFSFKECLESSLAYCNFFNNSARNLMYIYDLKNNPYSEFCNYYQNTVNAASLFCCYGHYRVSSSLFKENNGPLATTNWLKNGEIVLNQCVFDMDYQTTTNVVEYNCRITSNPTLIPIYQYQNQEN